MFYKRLRCVFQNYMVSLEGEKEEIISMIHSQQQHLFFSCENQFLLPATRCDCVLAVFPACNWF